MLFNLLLFALVATIAYFHYTQGFFSAALSAIIAVVAAVMAVSYHEVVAAYIIPKAPDWALAISLVGLFTVTYVVANFVADIIHLAIDPRVRAAK